MNPRNALAKGGLAGAACVACCAAPLILGLGVTAGIAATAAIFLGVAIAIAVALIGGAVVLARRHAHKAPMRSPSVPVSIGQRQEPQVAEDRLRDEP